jgi:hypothetical protein
LSGKYANVAELHHQISLFKKMTTEIPVQQKADVVLTKTLPTK